MVLRCRPDSHGGGHVAGKFRCSSACAPWASCCRNASGSRISAAVCWDFTLLNLTGYMFDQHLPLFTRGLSLFHGWLPLLLVWLLFRLGYDKRALSAWTSLASGLGARLLSFYSARRRPSGQPQHSRSNELCLRFQRPAAAASGSTKTFMSSCGWACCGSSPFSPPIWPCAKSSPRRNPRAVQNFPSGLFDHFSLYAGAGSPSFW